MQNRIVKQPVMDVIKQIDALEGKDVLVLGHGGSGKSVVLNEYCKSVNDSNLIVNGTVDVRELKPIYDFEIADVYNVALVVSKMLEKVKTNYPKQYKEFIMFEECVARVLNVINRMFLVGIYDKKYYELGRTVCSTPKILIEEFMELAIKILGVENVTVVIDDFDTIGLNGIPSTRYQQHIYKVLKQYVRLIATVSDSEILNNESEIERLGLNDSLIFVDYSKEVAVVKEIMSSLDVGREHHIPNIGLIVSDETIALMIKKTNGDLFDMIKAVRNLYDKIDSLNKNEYDAYLLDYIDQTINKNPIYTGVYKKKRECILKYTSR